MQKLALSRRFFRKVFFCCVFLLSAPAILFSQEEAEPKTASDNPALRFLNWFSFADEANLNNWKYEDKEINALTTVRPQKNKALSALVAAGETFIVNFLIWSGARFISKDGWAYITLESTKDNMRWSAWQWESGDSDVFSINQLWHPYAGMAYHGVARANGFNFYESIIFDAFGSFSWETFAENMHPSTNDFISTTTGGIIMGEILHRLFVELWTAYPILGATLGAGVSESDWVHGFLFRQGVRERSNKSIYELSASSGFSWTVAQFYAENALLTTWREPGAAVDIRLVYGNPFRQRSTTPYNQFELNFSLNGALYYDLTIITDGYLFSWTPIEEASSQGTTGLTLHYNFFNITNTTDPVNLDVGYENINFSDVSLDWAFKYRHYFNSDFYWSAKTHAGASGIAFSNSNDITNTSSHADYLFGGNIKLFLELSHTRWGTLCADTVLFECATINDVSMSDGHIFFGYINVSYSYPLGSVLSLVIADSFHYLNGNYTNISDIQRWFNNARIGIAINF
jgi:hypothetical protein